MPLASPLLLSDRTASSQGRARPDSAPSPSYWGRFPGGSGERQFLTALRQFYRCRHESGGRCSPPTVAAAPAASMTMDLNVSSRAPLCSPPLALDKASASASSPPVSAPSPVSSSAPGKRSFDVAFLVGPDERLEAARSGKQARAAEAHPQPHPQGQPHGQLRVVTLYYHSEDYIRSAFTKVVTSSGGRDPLPLPLSLSPASSLSLSPDPPPVAAPTAAAPYHSPGPGHAASASAAPESPPPPPKLGPLPLALPLPPLLPPSVAVSSASAALKPPPPSAAGASFLQPPHSRHHDVTNGGSGVTVHAKVAAAALLPPSLAALSLPAQNVCAKCNVSFRMTSDLVYHMRSHHKGESQAEALRRRRDQDKLRCPVCAETFRERHHLTRHMTAHQDKEGDLVDDK
ncbi:PR domain zinc finger protein 8 [Schistocerca gregaria]|uniref:PR domain zinc finger protein 8 n=1 Tax=Schistocerca gregaria TaxID=7010 RepID=UPI00211DFDC3|nr:PR domain zinc finger protein 8 [Schistocerca gregaria]